MAKIKTKTHTPSGYVIRCEGHAGLVIEYRWNTDGTHSHRWGGADDWEPINKANIPADVLHEFVAEQDRQKAEAGTDPRVCHWNF